MPNRPAPGANLARLEEINRRRSELYHGDPTIRDQAATALAVLEGQAGLLQVTRALEDPSVLVRLAAIGRLEASGRPNAMRGLISVLADSEPVVRQAASRALSQVPSDRARKMLLGAVMDADPAVRVGCCEQLAKLGGDDVVDALCEMLEDEEPSVRSAAALAMGEAGARDRTRPLVSLLDDKHAAVRVSTLTTLGRVGGRPEMDAVVRGLWDLEESVRVAACRALGELRVPESKPHVFRLIQHQPPAVVLAARETLALLGDAGQLRLLADGLVDADPAEREALSEVLLRIGPELALDPVCDAIDGAPLAGRLILFDLIGRLGDPRAVTRLDRYSSDAEWRIRRAVCLAFARLKDRQAVPTLLAGLWDVSPIVRGAAQDALLGLGEARLTHAVTDALDGRPEELLLMRDEHAIAALTQALLSPDPALRVAVCGVLGQTGDPEHLSRLAGRLNDEVGAVRIAATAALAELGDPGAARPLTHALADSELEVRRAAWSALARIGFEHAIEGLGELLYEAQDADTRALAADALGRSGSRMAHGWLASALEDPAVTVRATGVSAISALGGELAIELLLSALADDASQVRELAVLGLVKHAAGHGAPLFVERLEDPSSAVRHAACRGLAAGGGPAAVGPLLMALVDPDTDVQRAAYDALGALGEGDLVVAMEALLQGNVAPLLAREDRRVVPFLLAMLEENEPGVLGPACVALSALADHRAVQPLVGLLQLEGCPPEAGAALAAVVARTASVVTLWAETIGRSRAHAAGADLGAGVPRDPLGAVDSLVPYLPRPWMPAAVRAAVAGSMRALSAISSRLAAPDGSALVVISVKTGVLKRLKALTCEEGLRSVRLREREETP